MKKSWSIFALSTMLFGLNNCFSQSSEVKVLSVYYKNFNHLGKIFQETIVIEVIEDNDTVKYSYSIYGGSNVSKMYRSSKKKLYKARNYFDHHPKKFIPYRVKRNIVHEKEYFMDKWVEVPFKASIHKAFKEYIHDKR